MQPFYRLPPDFSRPKANTPAERRQDLAIETILAARIESHGETFERALCRLFALGPEWAISGCLHEIAVSRTIRRSSEAILDRAEKVWAQSCPLALAVAMTTKNAPGYIGH
jgi:hypothetical protein